MKLKRMERPYVATTHQPSAKTVDPMAEGLAKVRKPMFFYSKMSDDELVAFARRFMEENRIGGKKELDAVFSSVEFAEHLEKLNGVLDALDSFGDPK
jgi:hypothetical protein